MRVWAIIGYTDAPETEDVVGDGDGEAVDDGDEPDDDDDGAVETRARQTLAEHRVYDGQVALHRDHRQDDDGRRVADRLHELVQLTHDLQHTQYTTVYT